MVQQLPVFSCRNRPVLFDFGTYLSLLEVESEISMAAAAVEFLESFRLFLSKKLIMIEILRIFLLYQHVHFI
jgi:hypothetical protein